MLILLIYYLISINEYMLCKMFKTIHLSRINAYFIKQSITVDNTY